MRTFKIDRRTGAANPVGETKVEKLQRAGLFPGLLSPQAQAMRDREEEARGAKVLEAKRVLAAEIEAALPNFTGTHHYYKMTWLKLTDGCKFVAEKAGAYWLFTIAESLKCVRAVAREPFQVFKLRVDRVKCCGRVTVEDGNGKVLYTQNIGYTDFAMQEFEFWVERDVALLPSEH